MLGDTLVQIYASVMDSLKLQNEALARILEMLTEIQRRLEEGR